MSAPEPKWERVSVLEIWMVKVRLLCVFKSPRSLREAKSEPTRESRAAETVAHCSKTMSLVTKTNSFGAVHFGAGQRFLRVLGGLRAWVGGSFKVGSGHVTVLLSQNSSWGEAVKLGKLVRMRVGREEENLGGEGRRHGRIPYSTSLRKVKGSEVQVCNS